MELDELHYSQSEQADVHEAPSNTLDTKLKTMVFGEELVFYVGYDERSKGCVEITPLLLCLH